MDDQFSKRLKKLRQERGLSQVELAEKVALHANHYGRYERGSSRPTADALKRLADALGVSTDFLMHGAEDAAAKASFEDRELLRMFQEVEKLGDDDKNVIKQLMAAFLMKKQIQTMVT